MTLDQALEKIKEQFTVDDTLPKADAVELCSGGLREAGSCPALYVRQSDAVASWYSAFLKQAGTARLLRWDQEPDLEQFQMTMQDSRGTYRLVTDRYAVTSKVVFGGNGS